MRFGKAIANVENMRTWEAKNTRRLDQFFNSKSFLNDAIKIYEWVSSRRDLDHNLASKSRSNPREATQPLQIEP